MPTNSIVNDDQANRLLGHRSDIRTTCRGRHEGPCRVRPGSRRQRLAPPRCSWSVTPDEQGIRSRARYRRIGLLSTVWCGGSLCRCNCHGQAHSWRLPIAHGGACRVLRHTELQRGVLQLVWRLRHGRRTEWPGVSKHPDAPLCACFGFTLSEIEADVRDGTPTRIRAVTLPSRNRPTPAVPRSPPTDAAACPRYNAGT